MGKNTPARQEFIIENLRLEKDLITSDVLPVEEVAEADLA
jgi:topoisomerase-4 subunit B